jgi:UDP-glucose:(heptosyl)LPS alpha-1,3-glucosyltransferase
MRIALVLEKFDLYRGGAERSSYELACGLAQAGHEVTMLAGAVKVDQFESLPFGIMHLPVEGKTRTGWWNNYQKVLREHLSKADYDIVHSMVPLAEVDIYQPRGGSISYSAMRHAESYKSKLAIRYKRTTAGMNRGRAAKIAAERKICTGSEGPVLAALSRYVREQFETQYSLPPERIRVIRNGIDIKAIRNRKVKEQGAKLRTLYDRDGQLALFLFVAENLRLKGLTVLLHAAQEAVKLRSSQRDFRILVVSSEMYAPYYQLAQKLDLGNHIIFMGITRHVPALLHAADAVVLPTYNDACSRIVLEGLAAGTPAITTRYNGAADFVGAKHGMVLEDCEDARGLALALLTLCDRHEQKRRAMSIEADKLYHQVSVERHVRELVELYEEFTGI